MCALCRQTPCDPRCPNAPEPQGVMNCDMCGEPIFEGDRCIKDGSGAICEDCAKNLSVIDFMEIVGYDWDIMQG
mgnify:FL=1